jgi:hypothetical protein
VTTILRDDFSDIGAKLVPAGRVGNSSQPDTNAAQETVNVTVNVKVLNLMQTPPFVNKTDE